MRATANSLQPTRATWPFSIEKTSVLHVEGRQGTGPMQWAVGRGVRKAREVRKDLGDITV